MNGHAIDILSDRRAWALRRTTLFQQSKTKGNTQLKWNKRSRITTTITWKLKTISLAQSLRSVLLPKIFEFIIFLMHRMDKMRCAAGVTHSNCGHTFTLCLCLFLFSAHLYTHHGTTNNSFIFFSPMSNALIHWLVVLFYKVAEWFLCFTACTSINKYL